MVFDFKSLTSPPKAIRTPPQIIIYGTNGIGKSSIGAPTEHGPGAHAPVYMNINNRINHLAVAGNNSYLATYDDCEEFLRYIHSGDHTFRTLFIDTADDMERLIFSKVAKDAGKKVIGDIGYSKGYEDALDEWEKFLKRLTRIRDERGMSIVVLAQEDVRKHKNADGDDYEIIVPKLHGSTTKGDASLALFTAWADVILRMKQDVYTKIDGEGFNKSTKAFAHGGLFLYSKNNPAFRAKDTYGLPDKIDASKDAWQKIENGINDYWENKMEISEENKKSEIVQLVKKQQEVSNLVPQVEKQLVKSIEE